MSGDITMPPSSLLTTTRTNWLGFVLLLLLLLLLPKTQQLQFWELSWLDWQFQWQRDHRPKTTDGKVVLIGIDEASYTRFPEPFALWHSHLADLFRGLAIAKPKVTGIDFALPDRSFNGVIPGSDQTLFLGIQTLRKASPLVLGITIEQDGRTRTVHLPFLSAAGGKNRQGFVLWKPDADQVVRRFEPDLGLSWKPVPTLVTTMAKILDRQLQPGLIDYSLGKRMDYIPFHQVVDWYRQGNQKRLRQAFADKVVFVGTVLPFEDRHFQPVNLAAWEEPKRNYVPGVLIHVQAMRTLLGTGFIQPLSNALIYGLLCLISLLWWLRLSPVQSALTGLAGGLVFALAAMVFLPHQYHVPTILFTSAFWITLGGRQLLEQARQLKEKQRLRSLFSGYVSPQVLQEILDGHLQPGVFGERRHICLMFSDIRNFTKLSEPMDPQLLVTFLNRYLGEMTSAIQGHQGTLDKFIGDGIMAFFGAPKPLEQPAMAAFQAAKEKLQRLDKLNTELKQEGTQPLAIGIGLHMGEAVVGHIGSEERVDYTAIGDVVNTASRLEGVTKEVGYPLVISATVYEILQNEDVFDDLGEVAIKGHTPVHVYGWPARNPSTTSPL